MDWKLFKDNFHPSWHPYVKPWVESKNAAKVYTTLKNSKYEIAPKSNLTFRAFDIPLDEVRVVVYVDEPYCNKEGNIQYADGKALSCDYVEKIHPQLNEFYNAMEREFYDMNLYFKKHPSLEYYYKQGVLFLNSSLTVEVDDPGSHKDLWVEFNGRLIKNAFCPKHIPIIFCGVDIYEQYKWYLQPLHMFMIVQQSLKDCGIGKPWDSEGKFMELQEYFDRNMYDDIMWIDLDLPF